MVHITEADDRGRPADADVDIIDVEFAAADASLAGVVRVDVRRAVGATRFLAAVLRPGADPVVVIDYDLPLARSSFEFRSSGVWTELICEEPLDHWTIGLEAFGLGLPADEIATPESFGDRVPIGLDLDLDTSAAPIGEGADFAIDVRVHGEVLVGTDAYELEATGVRRRRTDGGRPMSDLIVSRPGLLGELTVGWPAADGQPAVERRGWFRGSVPGWTSLPVGSSAAGA